MGFIEDKNSILQQVSLFEVLGDLPENKTISQRYLSDLGLSWLLPR